jgi:hypothetical protein
LSEDTLADIEASLEYKAAFLLACEGAVSGAEYDRMTPDEVAIWARVLHKRNK